MDKSDNQHKAAEQISWVDYCDSLRNEHSWPEMQIRPASRIPERMPVSAATVSSRQERATEPA